MPVVSLAGTNEHAAFNDLPLTPAPPCLPIIATQPPSAVLIVKSRLTMPTTERPSRRTRTCAAAKESEI